MMTSNLTRQHRKTFLSFSLLLCISACSKTPELASIEGTAQGTRYHITFVLPRNSELNHLAQDIEAELARIDKSISNYRNDSSIEQFNAQLTTEPQEVPEEIVSLVEIARKVSLASHGCYDLTIKPLFNLWGFKKDVFNLPSDAALQQTLALVGMDKIETLDKNHLRKKIPDLRIDLSSIGQGYSVGKVATILEQYRIDNYIVEIGGELKAKGQKAEGKPWRIALEKPLSSERKIEKIAVFHSGEAMSLMPSGTYHHYFDYNGKRYSHILNAHTGKPIEHNSVSASVLNPDPTLADAWSTALLCLGSEEGIKVANENGIAALYIDQAGDTFVEKKTQALSALTSVTLESSKENP